MLVLTHRREILKQTSLKLSIDHGLIQAGLNIDLPGDNVSNGTSPLIPKPFTSRAQPIDLKPSQNHSLYSQGIVLSA